MRKTYYLAWLVSSFFVLCQMELYGLDMLEENKIIDRPPAVAGIFYPADKNQLTDLVKSFLTKGRIKNEETPKAIIVPHAGYQYSGMTAGKAYGEIYDRQYDAIIILGPSHKVFFDSASVFDGESYVTPIGKAMIDIDLAREIVASNQNVVFSKLGHGWSGDLAEHAIEVQIPFLQIVQPNVPIVPIAIGNQQFPLIHSLVRSIIKAIDKSGKNVLVIASSDLSHNHSLQEAQQLDSKVIFAVKNFDYFRLGTNLFSRNWEACGGGPIVAAMMISQYYNAERAINIDYSTSASSTIIKADSTNVVGYMASIICKSDELPSNFPEFSNAEKYSILALAKKSVKEIVLNKKIIDTTIKLSQNFYKEYSTFVTIKKNGQLRGCMGHTIATMPLVNAIDNSAKLSATGDRRFNPVHPNEIDSLEYEVAILSKMRKNFDLSTIDLDNDGLYIVNGENTALFLPSVAKEQGWNIEEYLKNLCLKAGLKENAYLDDTSQIYTFKAYIIN